MKKILLLMVAVAIAFGAAAQNQPGKLLKPAAKVVMDQGVIPSQTPVKPSTIVDTKGGIQRIPFGSSLNMLTLLAEENNNLFYNEDLGIMMFSHRAGGTYGGQGGDIRCHYTPYYGTGIDSVVFTQQANFRMRYPGGVIYNPTGNTNPDNAYAVITGPITDGSGWIRNYFCSQKLDGTHIKFRLEPTLDTFAPPYNNLTVCDGGKFWVAGKLSSLVSTEATIQTGDRYIRKGVFNTDSVDWTGYRHNFYNNYKSRHFSNDTTPWAFNDGMAWSNDGMTGYFYVIGWEDADDALLSGPKPIVWKTIDGGATWNKMPKVELSDMNAKFKDYIKPIVSTFSLDTSLWVFRPGIMCGSTVEENHAPGIVDNNGNLHIACMVEGMYSNELDSLEYTYAANPWNMFDIHTTSTGWDATIVDTIHSGIDEQLVLSDEYRDHDFHVAKTSDESVLFFIWTDTKTEDMNISPEIYVKAFDLTAGEHTPTIQMTNEMDYYYVNAAQQAVDSNGYYSIPCTFAIINGSTTDAEPTHNFIKGIKITPNMFDPDYSVEENAVVNSTDVTVSPNPAQDYVNVKFELNVPCNVKISAYNLVGSEVITKDMGKFNAGLNQTKVNISDLPSGIYFVTLQAGNSRVTKKIVVE